MESSAFLHFWGTSMLKPGACRLAAALTTTTLLVACGGGGGDNASSPSSTGTLSSANSEIAAADALAMSVEGSLVMNLSGYFVPEAGVGTSGLSGTMTAVSVTSTPETTNCAGGGTVTLTSGSGTASWVYANCIDENGITLNGQVASVQLDAERYQGDFTGFSVTLPAEAAVMIDGRLVYGSNATITEMQSTQLRVRMGTAFDLTMTNYLLRFTDVGTQTMIEARGGLKAAGATAYDIRFDNTTAGDTDQAPFYLNDGDLYPVSGNLEIFDNTSSSRITIAAINNIQVYIQYLIGSQTSSVWKNWSELL